jgi:hypothetical protein
LRTFGGWELLLLLLCLGEVLFAEVVSPETKRFLGAVGVTLLVLWLLRMTDDASFLGGLKIMSSSVDLESGRSI